MANLRSVPKAEFIALFCEAITFGIYTVIFVGAMYLLLRIYSQSRTHKLFIGLTVLMYSISVVHLSLSLRQSLVAFFQENATDGGLTTFNDPQGSPFVVSQTSLELVNCLMGDSIVAWRAWVLWGGGKAILVLPVLLITTGVATGSLLVHAYVTSPISPVLINASATRWVEIFGAVTFAANFYAIVVIAYKAWQHERAIKGLWSDGGKLHRVLLVVIESGMIYCLVLMVIIIFISAGNDFAVVVMIDMLAHLTGIYPSIILLLVSAKLAYTDQIQRDTTLASMQYNRPAPGLRIRRRPLTSRDEESGSYALDSVAVDIRLRPSRPETSSKPFTSATEEADSFHSKKSEQSEEAVEAKG